MNPKHGIAMGVLAAGLIGMLYCGEHFLLESQRKELKDTQDLTAAKNSELQDTKAQEAQWEKFQANDENVKRDLLFYTQRLDDPMTKEQLYSLIIGLCLSQNLREPAGEFEEKAVGSDGLSTLVTWSFKGDLARLGGFLNACVSQSHLIIPKSLELNRYDDVRGDYRDTLSAKVVLELINRAPGARGGKT